MFILSFCIVGFVGLYIGSYITAISLRITTGEKLCVSRSKCDNCGVIIGHFYLIPVIGYLLCRGKCGSCGGRVSKEYMLWEVIHTTMYLINFYLLNENLLACALLCCVSSILMMISIVDIKTMYIYDIHIIILFIFLVSFLLQMNYLNITAFSFVKSVYPLLFKFLYEFIRQKITKEKLVVIGMGDVKLFAILFFLLDFYETTLIVGLSGTIGVFYGIVRGRGTHYPFIPSISLGLYILFIYFL